MTRLPWKQRAVVKVKATAATKDTTAGDCRWCDPRQRKPSQAAVGKGLNRSMCRQHADHLARHGHPLKPTYKATDLRPLEALAKRWLKPALNAAPPSPTVALAVARARNIILEGRDPGQLLPTKTKPKAVAIIGRLHSKYCGERYAGVRTRWPRQRSIDALAVDLIAMVLAVELAHTLDPAPASNPRFAETQIGKVVFRRAGGWLRRSEREDHATAAYRQQSDGTLKRGPAVYVDEINRYAASRGRALAIIGKSLRDAVGPMWERHKEQLEADARRLSLAPIENWTLARLQPKQSKPQRGGRKPRNVQSKNPFQKSHDTSRKLTRPI